jgi:hypothetical protein
MTRLRSSSFLAKLLDAHILIIFTPNLKRIEKRNS